VSGKLSSVKVALATLGCKVNQLETEAFAEAFKTAGFRTLPGNSGEADLFVINTCTVTSKAEQRARRIIRFVLNSGSCLIVTGCYAQVDSPRLRALDPSGKKLFVLPGDRKSGLLDLPGFLAGELPGSALAEVLARWFGEFSEPPGAGAFRFKPEHFSFHSRAFLKIQDGCDNRCAYCRVPLARGPSVSLGAAQVLTALRDLEARGQGEAVLTGVHIGHYRDGDLDLAGLVGYLLAETREIRLRLSSLDPESFSSLPLGNPRIRPHFHLSVQSGSDSVLARMGRGYRAPQIREAVQFARSLKEDPFVACDIIAGFPGERAEDFEATYRLCRDLDFAGIHGFPYSPRPGTPAYTFKPPVNEREAGFRVARLITLGTENRRRYAQRCLGRVVESLTEESSALPAGQVPAISENYLKLLLRTGAVPPKPGTALRVRLISEAPEGSGFDAWAEPE
jgi:threonylcarbamoyladenosine tRNA methylthiotransferase MtaB